VVCVRRAWLTMGSLRLELEDSDAGYYCTELDLGYPDVREVTSNRPDRDGVDDRTRLMGSRAVSANIRGTDEGTMTPDEIATTFAPYMIPGVRPQLHYVLDRPGLPERFVTLRAAGYAWPISGARSREIQLSWVAPDPVLRDPTVRVATAFAGSTVTGGRTYSLVFDRTYPPAGGGPTVATISSAGDVPVRPRVDIYGPVTDPVVTFDATDAGGAPLESFTLRFVPGFRIDAGAVVSIDTDAKTVADRAGASLMGRLDWAATVWPILPVAPNLTRMALAGSSTSSITQAQATWTDGYLA
jgi:hypothetical protein